MPEAFEVDPRFRKLNYDDQVAVRQGIALKRLAADPRFVGLDPQAKAAVMDGVARKQFTKAPGLSSYATEITDEDRMAFAAGTLAADPDAAYKTAIILGERLEAGDANPELAKMAHNWVVGNRALTESLLAKVALGAKDAIEVLFGADDAIGDDLRFHSSDYQKLSTYLVRNMPEAMARRTTTDAAVLGTVTAFAETALMNVIGVGTLKNPGLFTKGLWNGINAQRAAAASKAAVGWAARGLPMTVEAVGSGTIDVLRKLPELIETGALYGPEKLFKGMAATFGEGVAFDFVFNTARDAYAYLLKPTAKAIKGLDLANKATLAPFLDAADQFAPERFSKMLSELMSGRIDKASFDQLDDAGKRYFTEIAARMKTMATVPDFDVRSPGGFQMLSKAMGFDAAIDKKAGVQLFRADGSLKERFKTLPEAVSYMIKQGQLKNPVEAASAEAFGAAAEGRLRTTMRTKVKIQKLSDSQLGSLIAPNFSGQFDDNTLKEVAVEALKRYDVDVTDVKFIDEIDWIGQGHSKLFTPEGVLTLPKSSSLMNRYYQNTTATQVRRFLGTLTGNIHAFEGGVAKTLNFDSLSAAVARLPGGKLTQLGDKFNLEFAGQKLTYSELTEVNRVVTDALLSAGVLSEDEIIEQVGRATGFKLTKQVDPLGGIAERWVLRDEVTGREIEQADTLMDMLSGKLDFSPRLPESLAPDMIVENGKLTMVKTVAYGPVSSLRKIMADFGPAEKLAVSREKPELVKRFPDGSELTYKATTAHYALEVPTLGIYKSFRTSKAAENYLKQTTETFAGFERLAHERGYRLIALPDGTVGLHDGTKLIRCPSTEALEKAMMDSPDSHAPMELFTYIDDEFDAAIRDRTVEALKDVGGTDAAEDAGRALNRYGTHIRATIGTMVRPALSSFEELARVYKKPEIVEQGRQFLLRRRFVGQQTYTAAETLKRMLSPGGKLLKKSDMEFLGKLLQYDEGSVDQAAKNLMRDQGYALPAEYKAILTQSRQYLAHMGEYFGIDTLRFLKSYVPHIQEVLSANDGLAKMLTNKSREEVMQAIFGDAWKTIPEVGFLAKNARLDSFLDAHNQTNLLNTLMWYTEHGLREKFLGPQLDQMRTWLKDLAETNVNPSLLQRVGGFYAAAVGGDNDYAGVVLTDVSIEASKRISKAMLKLSAVFEPDSKLAKAFGEAAEKSISTNYLDKASSMLSYATLGWRPFRAMANMTQYMNTFAVFGHYAEDAVGSIDDDYVKKLFSKGILNEKIFAGSGGHMGSKMQSFLDKSLSWQQNSEYLTRAWTAKTVELAFNESADKLAKGLYGTGDDAIKRFMRVANLDILDPQDQAAMAQLMAAGKLEGARDLAQASAVRILMFDYAKENYPMMFKGTMGKLFGKFGVFPVGQIDLYRRIAGSGDYRTRVARGARLMATSLAIYEGFRQVGIDYSGFLFTDPFSFAGGPLYQTAQDLLNSRQEGIEGQLARGNLARNWSPIAKGNLNVPRLAVPGGLQLVALQKAATTAQRGQYAEALLDALSAPRDTSFVGPGQWYW